MKNRLYFEVNFTGCRVSILKLKILYDVRVVVTKSVEGPRRGPSPGTAVNKEGYCRSDEGDG